MNKIKNIFVFLLIQAFYINGVYSSRLDISSFTCDSLDHEYNEDRTSIKKYDDLGLDVYAVFDGHGGSEVSQYLQDNFADVIYNLLQDNLLKNNKFLFEDILKQACNVVDQDLYYLYNNNKLFEQTKGRKLEPGSTATGVCFYDNKIYIFNVGDSRSCLWNNNGEVIFKTDDQKADINREITKTLIQNGLFFLNEVRIFSDNDNDKFYLNYFFMLKSRVVFDEDIHEINLEESEKIQNAFDKKENFEEYFKKSIDEITYLECGYLYNRKKEQILSMESAFGDFYLREYGFKPVPEIKVIDRNSLDNNLKYLLIASDGLWDIDNGNNNIFEVFENSFHINLVNRIVDENLNIARSLCSFARCQEGSPDDISAICITFN